VTLPHDPTSALFQHPDKLLINTSIPLLLTTTHTEAGALVQYSMPGAVPGPEAVYAGAVAAFLNNATLAGIILGSGLWPFVPGDDGVRVSLETLITDGVWRCSNRAVAGQLAARGFNAYVAEWTRGKIYPFNAGTYCAKSGSVCHGVSSEILGRCDRADILQGRHLPVPRHHPRPDSHGPGIRGVRPRRVVVLHPHGCADLRLVRLDYGVDHRQRIQSREQRYDP
jgi:hypothetical protein